MQMNGVVNVEFLKGPGKRTEVAAWEETEVDFTSYMIRIFSFCKIYII